MKRFTRNSRERRWIQSALLIAPLLIQLLLPGRAFALDPTRSLLQYNCRTWSRQNGLPANGVNAITQTRDGYLWLGTAAGLVRFDGIEFKLLDLSSVTNFSGSTVTSLAGARNGGLWVVLDHSPFGYFDGRSFSFRGKQTVGAPDMNVHSLTETEDGTLWIAAESGALRLTRSGTFEQLMASGPFTNATPNVLCDYEDRQGRLWFGTANRGLYYWQAGKMIKVADPELDAALITCLAEDREGQIWVGTTDGLRCLDSNLRPKEIPLMAEEVRALLVDDHDVLWIGTAGRGLGRYQNGTYEFLERADGLGSDYVNALAEDHEGSLWIGTRGGVSQLADVKFPTQPAAENPSVKNALAVCASHQGGVWIGSPRGVTYFDPATGRRKTYGLETGIPFRYIKRVFEASNGDLYLVCYIKTLAILSPAKKLVAVYTNSDLVVGMAEDAHGVVVSVAGELYRAGTNYFQPYAFTNAEKPPMYWTLNLASGRDGVIWVACAGGIFRVKDGAYQRWSAAEGLTAPVLWVCEDNEGVVWGATLRGIVRLKDNRISFIDRQHGLFDDNIYSVIPDDLGNLWVDSGRGIFSVSRQSVNDFADGKTARVQCTVFDGMNSVKPSDKTDQERVACKTSDGRIWFPSANGVVMIDPAHVPINRVAPPVHIDLVKADGKEVARGEAVTVPPGKGELEFHFNALTFIAPQKARFRYRLQGYDNDWVEAGNRRMAFYTNLKPGTYAFQVIAANADGVWNQKGDLMNIKLLPHYYQTVWFDLLCGGLACGALAGIYAGRVRHLVHKQQTLQTARERLETEVMNRTAELAKERLLLRTLIDNLPDLIFAKDLQSRFIVANTACVRQLGAGRVEEVLGKTDADFVSLELASQYLADEQALMQSGQPLTKEELTQHKDTGETCWSLTTKAPLKDETGKVMGLIGIARDITERKQAEASLRLSREEFRDLFDNAPVGFHEVDAEGRLVRINNTQLKMQGYTVGELLGQFVWKLSADEEATRQNVLGILRGERPTPQNIARAFRRKDGSTFPVMLNARVLRREDGAITGIRSAVEDITEQKQAEAALAAEQRLLNSLITATPDQIYFKDRESRFIRINEAFARRHGLSDLRAILGKTDFDIFGEQHARQAYEDEQRIAATGQPIIGKEEREDWKDGHVTWVSSTKMPLRDNTGKIVGIMGISRDITEHKQAEAELNYERSLWRTLLDNSPDHIYFKDTQSRFIKASQSMTRLFGVESQEEMLGKTDFDFFAEAHARPAFEDEQEIIRTGQPMIAKEEQEVWKDGRVTWASSTKIPLRDDTGKIIGVMGISRDITEHKRLEEHLVQSQKMETVGKLAGGVAHEFNSILTAIIGQCALLLQDLPAGSPLAKNAAEISQAAERAATLTQQLLAYGRKQFLRPQALNLNQVITSMNGVLSHLMGGEMVEVTIVPAAGLKAVKADAGQIEQVIINLAMNARDAMPHGGKFTLETANVTLDQEYVSRYPELKAGDYVMLAVTDTGRGMSEGVKARAFEPFFTTKDVGQGTGLGLSTCYGIIKQSGGHISVYSEPGRGTTFKIYLPQVEPPLPKTPAGHPGAPDLPRGTETILLVEDDPALREMAATLLQRLGYTVWAAANGIEALSLKQQRGVGHVDLLFTDVVMPHMSGKELSERVRALFPHTRILFTSAYSENAIVHQGVLDKGVALLPKPFTPAALASKVREVLDQPAAPPSDSAPETLGLAEDSDDTMTTGSKS
jgi:two-component system cell cycle sensor histidine kinase/response regulator CckA